MLRALQPPAVSFAESSCGSRGRLAPSLAEPSCGSASSERRTEQHTRPELSRTTSLESVSFYPRDDPRYGTVVDQVTRRRMEAAVVTIQLVWKQRKLGYDAARFISTMHLDEEDLESPDLGLAAEAAKEDLPRDAAGNLYSLRSPLAIFDTMNHIKSKVVTINVGLAASMASFLLTGGTKGSRLALPNSRVMIHQPMGGAQGQAEDIKVEAAQIVRIKENLVKLYSMMTGQTTDQIIKDLDRDNFMSAQEACSYGIVDKVIDVDYTK